MKGICTAAFVGVFVCLSVCGRQPMSSETNRALAFGGATNANASTWLASEEKKEVDEIIAHAPELLLFETSKRHYSIGDVCDKIGKCPDASIRYRLFRELMSSVCSVKLEQIEGCVPSDYNVHTNSQGVRIHTLNLNDRGTEVARRLGNVYGLLDAMADKIHTCLWTEKIPAPGVEQFAPYFMLIERLKTDERRLGQSMLRMLEARINHVEYLFNFVYLRDPRRVPDASDRIQVEYKFRQVVGRPIRSPEAYMMDSRRKVGRDKECQSKMISNDQEPKNE